MYKSSRTFLIDQLHLHHTRGTCKKTMEDRGSSNDNEATTTISTPRAPSGENSKGSDETSQNPVPPTGIETPKPGVSSNTTNTPKTAYSLEDANEELSKLISMGKTKSADVAALKSILNEHENLKEKVDKLKSLLGRSAKAQRETKVDLEASQKRLNQALREMERLNQKLDKLQSRPTHLDLLMDFESNFDRALLSVGQTGGEDTSASPPVAPIQHQESALDSMLLQELGEAKSRIEKLETLNSTLMSRSSQMESTNKNLQKERDDALQQNDRLHMELRMAKMEAEYANRAMQDKQASLEEMQMEIDLVTKASAKANSRAAKGEEMANSLKSDRQRVHELEAQVQALREWALASAESKRLMQERCNILERKLKQSLGRGNDADSSEAILFSKNGSMVIGAGDKSISIIELGSHAAQVDARFVILRWKFDFSPSDSTIEFNILKGKCETASQQSKADYIVKDRVITGGAGGDTEGAFNIDGACTLLWSNAKSWVRPRTVKYSVDVVSLR